jgi:hypothetical protein
VNWSRKVGKALACSAAAGLLLASCSSGGGTQSGGNEPGSKLDGTFSAQFGLRTTVYGTAVPDTGITVKWVARSTCSAAGCVATVTEVRPDNPGDPRPPTMVFDLVNDSWVSVREVPSLCENSKGEPINVQGWQGYTLKYQPDGTLVGTYTNRSSIGGACNNSSQSVTVKRSGDVDQAVAVADPAAQPGRVSSPGSALRGTYRQTQTNPQTGEVYPTTDYAGNTQCLRTGDRCLTYMVDPQSKALLVLTFADGKWTSASAPIGEQCPNGQPGFSVLTGEFPLPQPVSDPIAALTGNQRTVRTGACPASLTLAVKLDRIGD